MIDPAVLTLFHNKPTILGIRRHPFGQEERTEGSAANTRLHLHRCVHHRDDTQVDWAGNQKILLQRMVPTRLPHCCRKFFQVPCISS